MEDPLRAIAAAITATSRSVRRMLAVGQALLPAAASATRAARLHGGGARRTMTNITTMFALAVLITSGGLIERSPAGPRVPSLRTPRTCPRPRPDQLAGPIACAGGRSGEYR
jgi:hypothetical protein